MKSRVIFVLLHASFLSWSQAYEPKALFITDPGKAIGFVEDVANFYRGAKDPAGGYHTFIESDGSIAALQGHFWKDYEHKSFCALSRIAYAFMRTFMLTGDTTYLSDAQHALDFLYTYGWDNENEGWFFTRDITNDVSFGTPWAENDKWTFQQQYALVGIIAMVEATGGASLWSNGARTDRQWLDESMNSLFTNVWDASPAKGYFENATVTWENKSGKGFTGTIDGISTHAALAAFLENQPEFVDRFQELSDIARDRLVGNMSASGVKVGFPESYTTSWEIERNETGVSIGHLLKTAWNLGRAAIYFGDDSYREAAEQVMDQVWETDHPDHENLYDHLNGAPYATSNWETGNLSDRNKNHWVVEQGLTAGLINFYNASTWEKQQNYLQMADETIHFFEQHMIDKTYGASYMEVSESGENIVDDTKGDNFKSGFHDVELGYYTYLYAQAYYHHQPFTLYYYFDGGTGPDGSSVTQRTIQLNPIAIPSALLSIDAVSLDGNEYTDYNSESRELTIDENVSGIFAVTFMPSENPNSPMQPEEPVEPLGIAQSQNWSVYPNPFQEGFRITNFGNSGQETTVRLFDLNGKMLNFWYENNPGEILVCLHENIKDGLYILEIKSHHETVQRKLIKN